MTYFYPRPLRGGRRPDRHPGCHDHCISIHALCEEGDQCFRCCGQRSDSISIHALCEEGDPCSWRSTAQRRNFYPRPLRGGRLDRAAGRVAYLRISIHALCEEGDAAFLADITANEISIHALCEEGDARQAPASDHQKISIHALCEEGDTQSAGIRASGGLFLSTPSARRATIFTLPSDISTTDFYPRPLRGGRRFDIFFNNLYRPISIHALCEEGDCPGCNRFQRRGYFYPRPLRGGRRGRLLLHLRHQHFYPRPLRGGRPPKTSSRVGALSFLSTPSARRATLFAQ